MQGQDVSAGQKIIETCKDMHVTCLTLPLRKEI